MAPVLKRVTIDSTGSTSSSGTGSRTPGVNSNSPRNAPPSRTSRFTSSEYCWNTS